MNNLILAAALVCLGLIAVPVTWAVEAHHPAGSEPQSIEQITMDKDSPTVNELEDMRMKVQQEPDPAKRHDMMHKHMMMMRDSMKMMSRMGAPHGAMAHGGHGGDTPMEHRMSMMEHKMKMMEKMMGKEQGGMMGGGMMKCGMMGGMSGGAHAGADDEQMKTMEKKIEVLQEVVNGLLLQQELDMNQPNRPQ